MMRADKVRPSRVRSARRSPCERPSQHAVTGGKPPRASPQAVKATRPLTACCGRYHEESVRSSWVLNAESGAQHHLGRTFGGRTFGRVGAFPWRRRGGGGRRRRPPLSVRIRSPGRRARREQRLALADLPCAATTGERQIEAGGVVVRPPGRSGRAACSIGRMRETIQPRSPACGTPRAERRAAAVVSFL